MAKKQKERKEMVFIIEYRVSPEDAWAISEVMDKMREQGAADISAINIETIKVDAYT